MTLSTLICTKCQSAYAVTGRSVVFPCVCPCCEADAARDMEMGTCDSASVEATTQLIDDLTAQLEAERATVMQLKETLTATDDVLLKMKDYCEELGRQLHEANGSLTSLIGRNIELLAEVEEAHIREEKCYSTIAKLINQRNESMAKAQFAGEVLTSIFAIKN